MLCCKKPVSRIIYVIKITKINGADDQGRTDMRKSPSDFESDASANSATSAFIEIRM